MAPAPGVIYAKSRNLQSAYETYVRAHSYVYYAAKNPVDFVAFNYTFAPEGGRGVGPRTFATKH